MADKITICKHCHAGLLGKHYTSIVLSLNTPEGKKTLERGEYYCLGCAKGLEQKLKKIGMLKKQKEKGHIKD